MQSHFVIRWTLLNIRFRTPSIFAFRWFKMLETSPVGKRMSKERTQCTILHNSNSGPLYGLLGQKRAGRLKIDQNSLKSTVIYIGSFRISLFSRSDEVTQGYQGSPKFKWSVPNCAGNFFFNFYSSNFLIPNVFEAAEAFGF